MITVHLNWRWITSFCGILFIFWWLATMFPKIDLNVKRIKKNCDQLDIKNKQLESTLIELKATNLQFVQNKKMATLGNLVAGVAHEINNPIGFISGNINAAPEYFHAWLYAISLYQQEFYTLVKPEIANQIKELDIHFITQDYKSFIEFMKTGVNRIAKLSKSWRIFSRVDSEHKTTFNLSEGIDIAVIERLKYEGCVDSRECGNDRNRSRT